MYKTILLPTDGTRGVDEATEHAVDLAATYGATLHALYVVDEGAYAAYGGDEYVHEGEGLENALERQGETAVNEIASRADEEGVETVSVIERGYPHEVILAHADEIGADLLVLGTKTRSGEYRRLLGSVTERVARLGATPVMVVKTPIEG